MSFSPVQHRPGTFDGGGHTEHERGFGVCAEKNIAEGLKKAIQRLKSEGRMGSSDPRDKLWELHGLIAYMIGWTADEEPKVSEQFRELLEMVRP